MKRINFLSTLSPHQQHALSRWIINSTLLLGLLVCIIFTFQTFQLITLYRVYQEQKTLTHTTDSFATTMKKQHEYTTKITTMRQYCDTLEQQKKQLKNLQNICKTLIPTDPISLIRLTYQQKKSELIITAPTPEHITTYAHTLTQNTHITSLDMISLQPQKNTSSFNATFLIHYVPHDKKDTYGTVNNVHNII